MSSLLKNNNEKTNIKRAKYDKSAKNKQNELLICLVNPRSLCNKTLLLNDFCTSWGIDILCITETWLKGNDSDKPVINELTPLDYAFDHTPRLSSKGGGTGILYRSSIIVKSFEHTKYRSFEHHLSTIHGIHMNIILFIIYRLPQSAQNKMNVNNFLEEFEF